MIGEGHGPVAHPLDPLLLTESPSDVNTYDTGVQLAARGPHPARDPF